MEFRTTSILKVYTGEDVIYNGRPLYKAILNQALEHGIAGATASKGIAGFASQKRGIGRAVNTLFSGSSNMPIIIEMVDDREKLETILPFLEKHASHAFVTIEDCTYLVTDYMREKHIE